MGQLLAWWVGGGLKKFLVGNPDCISTKDLIEKNHELRGNVLRRLGWHGHAARRYDNNMVKQLVFLCGYPNTCSLLDGLVALGCIVL